jgi:hypothetical protein
MTIMKNFDIGTSAGRRINSFAVICKIDRMMHHIRSGEEGKGLIDAGGAHLK